MDPNATLREIQDHLDTLSPHGTTERMEELDHVGNLCIALSDWLLTGGFEPEWSAHPEAATYFDKFSGRDVKRSIEALVASDYDGGEDPGDVAEVLNLWCRNNDSARDMIEARGKVRAEAEYRAAWDEIYRSEYGALDE